MPPEKQIELFIPQWSVGESSLRIKIHGNVHAIRRSDGSMRRLTHTAQMLAVCLADLVPRLKRAYKALDRPESYVYAETLRWAKGKSNFMRAVAEAKGLKEVSGSALKGSSMSPHNVSQWYTERPRTIGRHVRRRV